jgi:two-component system chemotaxis response regulator CheY
MRVMVVDDSSTMLEYMKSVLKSLDIKDILIAKSGKEAFDIFRDNSDSIDMIFTDWNMPNMDGIGFIKRVREIDTSSSIYITMVTTECKKIKVVEALEAGADNYAVKPFSKKRLMAIMGSYFSKNREDLEMVV